MNSYDIKKSFKNHFESILERNGELQSIFFEIFIYGTAYIIGGYLRDFLNNKRESRDMDVITDIPYEQLIKIIKKTSRGFTLNRHKGIKLKIEKLEIDIWTISNNWAFKNNLVKLNENDKLNSIAKGCFYNYDALVINLSNFSYNIRHYLDFLSKMQLHILHKSSIYKNLNPTTEANILRAIYLKETLNVSFSPHTLNYLYRKIGALKDVHGDELLCLLETLHKYPKYEKLSYSIIKKNIEIIRSQPNNRQLFLDF